MKQSIIGLLAINILHCTIIFGRSNCLDNSWHLQKEFDNKEYHQVTECLCPCDQTLENRNQCVRCNHYHDAQPWIIVPTRQQQVDHKDTTWPVVRNNLKGALAALISTHRAKK